MLYALLVMNYELLLSEIYFCFVNKEGASTVFLHLFVKEVKITNKNKSVFYHVDQVYLGFCVFRFALF